MESVTSFSRNGRDALSRYRGSQHGKCLNEPQVKPLPQLSDNEREMRSDSRFRILDGTRIWGSCHRYLPDESLPICSKEELDGQTLSGGYILPKMEWYTKQCDTKKSDIPLETMTIADEISIQDAESTIKTCKENVTSSIKLIKESKKSMCQLTNPNLYEMYCQPCLEIPKWFLNIFRKSCSTEYGFRTFMLNATFPRKLKGAPEEYEQTAQMLFTLCVKLNIPDCSKPRFYQADFVVQEQYHLPSGQKGPKVDKLKKSWREMYTCQNALIASCNKRRVHVDGNYKVDGTTTEFSIVFLREHSTTEVAGTYMKQMRSCEKFLTWRISDEVKR